MSDIKRVVVWSDLHLGLRGNEKRHNEECLEFCSWMIDEFKKFGANTSIFMGDWGHYRNTVQTTTLNYSLKCFELLSKSFDKHYQIIGNHDLFYKDNRSVNSVEFARDLPNIQIINEITKIDENITLSPWLMDSEFSLIKRVTTPYIFGHFEFPHFLVNAMVAMPDIGKIHADDFKMDGQRLFSGHFHKRQKSQSDAGNIIEYIGNCFPHSYSDSNDDLRGIMLLEIGKEPIYKAWPNAPKFRTMTLTKLLEDPAKHLDNKTSARITIDSDISYEEANFIRETMITEYNPRELSFIPYKEDIKEVGCNSDIKFESLDQIIIDHLKLVESNSLDSSLLIDIYNNI